MTKIINISIKCMLGGLICLMLFISYSSPFAATRDEIVLAWKADTDTLDPHDLAGWHGSSNQAHIHEGLVRFDEQMKVHPHLAESWETEDAQTWNFKLRKGVTFHDGTPFNAESVKVSIDRMRADRDPFLQKALRMRPISSVIKEVRVIDDYSLQIITEYPFGPLIYSMAHPSFTIISPTAWRKYQKDYGNNPVGTGPYRFSNWRRGDRIVLERYDEYWRDRIQPVKRPKRVVFRAIAEDAARIMALETGEADVITFVPVYEIERLQKDPRFVVKEIPSMTVIYFGMNHLKKPFNDVRVRKALSYAVDKESIVKHILKGHGSVPDSIASPQAIWYSPGVKYEYNPAKAKELLAQAGYPNGFKTRMLVAPGKFNMDREFVEFARKNFREVGVELELEQVEWATHTARLSAPPDKKDYEMWLRSWAPGTGETSYTLRAVFHSDAIKGGWNWSAYNNPELDRLIEKALAEPEASKIADLVAKGQRIVTEDAVWIPIIVDNLTVAFRKEVHGVEIFPNEPVMVRNAYIE